MDKIKWWDVLFKTQRYLDFCNHVTVLESSIPQLTQFEAVKTAATKAQNEVQGLNRELTRVNRELTCVRAEMGQLQTAYDLSVREANSLGAQLAQAQARPKQPTAREKVQRYQQQYQQQGGQVQSTPADNSSILMQATFMAQQAEVTDDAEDRAAGYPDGGARAHRSTPAEESRSYEPDSSIRSEPSRDSDRSGGWGSDSTDSGSPSSD